MNTRTAARRNLDAILDEVIDWRYKGFPATAAPVTIRTIAYQQWNVSEGDLLFPLIVLKEDALRNNIAVMARYCERHALSHAPHGKTPMAPQIVERQLDAGAWTISTATVSEVRVFRAFGVPRIFLANELLEPTGIRWIAEEMEWDPGFEFLCLVDSVDGVQLMEQELRAVKAARAVSVLIEWGPMGGRAGCRTRDAVRAVVEAIGRCDFIRLAGVEGYEGAVPTPSPTMRLAAVDAFLRDLRAITEDLDRSGAFSAADEILVSAGGSLFFDRVADILARDWHCTKPVRTVVRAGSYIAHDVDMYEQLSPLGGRGAGPDCLQPALEAWGVILSRPEPELAVVGFGKRDVPYDVRLPIPTRVRRGTTVRNVAGEVVVTAINDQHSFLSIPPALDLLPGDLLVCDVVHPCTTFDKWRLIGNVPVRYRWRIGPGAE